MAEDQYTKRLLSADSHVMEPRDMIGIDNLMWGSDYPHTEGVWPYSQESRAQLHPHTRGRYAQDGA